MADDLITEYLTHLRGLGRAESTIDTYAELLRRVDRHLPEGLVQACTEEIRDWIWATDRRPATRALYRTAIQQFFRWATHPADARLDYDPSALIPRQRIPARAARPIDPHRLADVLTRAREPFRTWYLIAAGGGLRCCEIAALDRQDVTEQEMWVQGKGGKERLVPTHPRVWEAVRDLPSGPIARRPDGAGRADRRQVRERANRYLQVSLGHRGTTMHQLRHWYGTQVYEASGQDLRVAQELLGHTSPMTTQVYVRASAGRMRTAVTGLALPGA